MFSGWAHLARPSEDLTEKERTPPPTPTKLDFPNYDFQHRPSRLTSASSRHIFSLLCNIKRPQEITPAYFQSFNLRVTPNVSFQDLLPNPTRPDHHTSTQRAQRARLDETIQELRTPLSAAFREIVRLPPLPGQPRTRLTHTREFWNGLEKMSQYWDSSMDQFYDVAVDADDDDSPFTDSDPDTLMFNNQPSHPTRPMKRVYKGRRIGNGSIMPLGYRDETVAGLIECAVWPYNCQVRIPALLPRICVRNLLFPVRQNFIVGSLPIERDIARRGILEGPVMGVCCRGETDFGNHSEAEGNVTAKNQDWRGRLDLMREVAVLLLLAQERARQGKSEVRPGEGKWWTSTPRWGGGLKNDILTENFAKKILGTQQPPQSTKRKASTDVAEAPISNPMDATQHKKGNSNHSENIHINNRSSPAEKWKILRPGPDIWDKKMKYVRIGAPSPPTSPCTSPMLDDQGPQSPSPAGAGAGAGARYDQIFVVSSINHHVALLSMKVSDRYLAWLAGDELEVEGQQQQRYRDGRARVGAEKDEEDDEEDEEELLQLKRTRWFDLFAERDRVEFVQGLWAVMGWLMRERTESAG